MTKKIIDTEPQQIAIASLRERIEWVCAVLFSEIEKYESQELEPETAEKLGIIRLRLDTLAKIDFLLMKPTAELYESFERTPPPPGSLPKIRESIGASLVAAMLQGL